MQIKYEYLLFTIIDYCLCIIIPKLQKCATPNESQLLLHHQCLIENITMQKQRSSSLHWIPIYASLH
ncbi:hypothetical protein T10_2161 [Trichinella papuae]|uniref:Uncharacterized protein n=1 Tax=Trichinella papuae TaxID=268474 RepID=A0A0V1M4A2_9BILA|nr:hypothetical protein T10_124 [Trichinella papuae]KRZ78549.1 hypothetical protein T10_2161 [Trichinella papuae]